MKIVISNLEKIYKKSRKQKKGRLELSQEMELFFGPSRVFGSIFKHALVRQFEIKAEQKSRVKNQQPLLSQDEKDKIAHSASNSQVDEIENLEKYRDTGIKPSGPLSEEMKDVYNKQVPFRLEKEPIFDSILLNMVLGNSVNLKKKARIKIKDSAVLIGIIDE